MRRSCKSCGKNIEEKPDDCICEGATIEYCEKCQKEKEAEEEKRKALELKTLDEQIRARFVCCKCKSKNARVKRISTTGDGFSRLMNFQNNVFLVVSCCNCGYVELYDPVILENKSDRWAIFDLLFGN
ncbi:MAG: Protein of unknown function nucleic-acid-binding, Zn-ribbon domain protein [Anaerosporomusa subterranea]|uniref:zinc ribbon domain-containing protein n=1 Tax=Anaerosporomusa subterranea TaxID=1794912 RepID=UPI0018D3707F|nr:zinc ribbon domain-containing protein [Anaerosporomusa subterranea]MDF2501991.1 Protein of unknown function nucleic-acid-binding, Zn-ribbon domain protein [Anaerosporomusa subterranea]